MPPGANIIVTKWVMTLKYVIESWNLVHVKTCSLFLKINMSILSAIFSCLPYYRYVLSHNGVRVNAPELIDKFMADIKPNRRDEY